MDQIEPGLPVLNYVPILYYLMYEYSSFAIIIRLCPKVILLSRVDYTEYAYVFELDSDV